MEGVIYTRQSLDRNGGRSTDDQERECRAEAARLGVPVVAVFCDKGISASRYGKARPDWEKCKKYLRDDQMLFMWESSRSARDLEEFVTLRNHCAKVGVLVSYSGRVLDFSKGDDRFTGGLDALLAERESEQFRERVLRGKRSGAINGRPAGRVKWGYRVASPGVWEPDPVEAPKVQESVARLLRGDSAYSIIQWLGTQLGYQPSTVTTLRRALRSPTYAGLRVHKGEVVGKGAWPALITEEQHRQLARRTRQRSSPPASPEPRHLLSGIAKCGKPGCGAGVGWRKNYHGTPTYACRKGHVSRLADPLDKLVEHRLFNDLALVDPSKYKRDDSASAAIRDELDAVDRDLADYREMAMNREVTPESFAMFEKALIAQEAALKARLESFDSQPPDLNAVRARWDRDDVRERRRIISSFLTVTIYPSTQGHKVGDGGVEIISNVRRVGRDNSA